MAARQGDGGGGKKRPFARERSASAPSPSRGGGGPAVAAALSQPAVTRTGSEAPPPAPKAPKARKAKRASGAPRQPPVKWAPAGSRALLGAWVDCWKVPCSPSDQIARWAHLCGLVREADPAMVFRDDGVENIKAHMGAMRSKYRKIMMEKQRSGRGQLSAKDLQWLAEWEVITNNVWANDPATFPPYIAGSNGVTQNGADASEYGGDDGEEEEVKGHSGYWDAVRARVTVSLPLYALTVSPPPPPPTLAQGYHTDPGRDAPFHELDGEPDAGGGGQVKFPAPPPLPGPRGPLDSRA